MREWTDDQEFSGRRAFDWWRFSEADRQVSWDWADMGTCEKRLWIDRAHKAANQAA
jgi:hypothetical protein